MTATPRLIGGTLDQRALARLHFSVLSGPEQVAAVRRLAAAGQGEHYIAGETGLSVEQVERMLVTGAP